MKSHSGVDLKSHSPIHGQLIGIFKKVWALECGNVGSPCLSPAVWKNYQHFQSVCFLQALDDFLCEMFGVLLVYGKIQLEYFRIWQGPERTYKCINIE